MLLLSGLWTRSQNVSALFPSLYLYFQMLRKTNCVFCPEVWVVGPSGCGHLSPGRSATCGAAGHRGGSTLHLRGPSGMCVPTAAVYFQSGTAPGWTSRLSANQSHWLSLTSSVSFAEFKAADVTWIWENRLTCLILNTLRWVSTAGPPTLFKGAK